MTKSTKNKMAPEMRERNMQPEEMIELVTNKCDKCGKCRSISFDECPNCEEHKTVETWEIEFDEKFSTLSDLLAARYEAKWIGELKDFIRQLLAQERQEVIEEIEKEMKDFLMDCLYEMEFEVINGNFAPYDDKGWPRWNEERKHQLDKLDAIIAKLKSQEYHRCPRCNAISSWDGCFCQRKRGDEK